VLAANIYRQPFWLGGALASLAVAAPG